MAEYKKFVTESTLKESSYEDILKHFPKQVQDFKNGGELDYDLESALWDYHFNNGDIRNYDADASEYIGQNLADYLGVDENMDEVVNLKKDPNSDPGAEARLAAYQARQPKPTVYMDKNKLVKNPAVAKK
jgi:hypothetical protein